MIEIQSTEPLPFLLIASSFLVSSLWFMYGMILKDKYIMVSVYLSLLPYLEFWTIVFVNSVRTVHHESTKTNLDEFLVTCRIFNE